MRKATVLIILNLILVIIQESFFLELFGPSLNISLILALAFGYFLSNQEKEALDSALFGGLVIDLVNPNIIGLSSLLFVVLLLIAGVIKRYFFKGFGFQLVVVVLSVCIYKLVISYPKIHFAQELVISGIMTFILSFMLHLLINKITHKFKSIEYRIRS